MSRYNNSNNDTSWFSCGCSLVILILNLFFGGTSVNYLLETFLGKTIPFGWAIFTGMFVGEFTIPTAIVVWVLKSFSVF